MEEITQKPKIYVLVEDNEFKGFYNSLINEITEKMIEISEEEHKQLLENQSLGEQIYYDKKSNKVKNIKLEKGQKIEGGSVKKDINLLKEIKLSELETIKNLKTEAGFKVKVDSQILIQRVRSNDISNIQGLVVGQTEQVDFKFKDLEDKDVIININASQIQKLFQVGMNLIGTVMIIESNLKTKIEETTKISEIEALDIEKIFDTTLGDDPIEL